MFDKAILLKYAAGAALIGSVLFLVVTGKVEADQYILIISGALAALGINAAGGQK